MVISKDKAKREVACAMLVRKAREKGKLPLKADFTSGELVFIKAHLGPWPRALEEAGLKERRPKTKIKIDKNDRP